MHKKIVSALLSAIMLCGFTSITAAADADLPKWWNDTIRTYDFAKETDDDSWKGFLDFFDLCKSHASYDEIGAYYRNNMQVDGAGQNEWLPDKAVDYFRSGKNGLIKIDYTICDHTRYSFIGASPRYDGFDFEIYTDKCREIEKIYHLDERTVYSVSEILSDIDLLDGEKVVWLCLGVSAFYSEIDNVEFYPCTDGWNTIDGEKYYVRSDGTLATRSMTIGGIRYKFGENGVCDGKYTGWTRSSKGRRYWKDGILQKNTEITTESGKVYKLDKNGYAKRKID